MKKQFSTRLDNEVIQELIKMRDETNISHAVFINNALKDHLAQMKKLNNNYSELLKKIKGGK